MKTVKTFEEFVNENYILNESKSQTLNLRLKNSRNLRLSPNYDLKPLTKIIMNDLEPLEDAGDINWSVKLTVPGIIEIQLYTEGKGSSYQYLTKVNPLTDLKTSRFPKDLGTNFPYNLIDKEYGLNDRLVGRGTKEKELADALSFIIRNACKAALVDKLNFDFEVDYGRGSRRVDYFKTGETGETFDPNNDKYDLLFWVDDRVPGNYDSDIFKGVFKQLQMLLPKQITAEINIDK